VRIVIDTNIWVSGLLWKGDAWRLLRLAEAGELEICIAYAMLLELEEVLGYERLQPRLTVLQQTPRRLAAYALSLATAVDVSRAGASIVQQDPDDDIFLLCVVAAGASYLVTHDNHLLNLGSYEGVTILRVETFMALLFPSR
jgi:hypothetical protein